MHIWYVSAFMIVPGSSHERQLMYVIVWELPGPVCYWKGKTKAKGKSGKAVAMIEVEVCCTWWSWWDC